MRKAFYTLSILLFFSTLVLSAQPVQAQQMVDEYATLKVFRFMKDYAWHETIMVEFSNDSTEIIQQDAVRQEWKKGAQEEAANDLRYNEVMDILNKMARQGWEVQGSHAFNFHEYNNHHYIAYLLRRKVIKR